MNEYIIHLDELGVSTRVIDEGKGPAVLLLHGNPDNADEWKTLINILKTDFRCIAPDLPGYGRRGNTFALPKNYDYSVDAQVGFVDALVKHLNIRGKMTLVVHDIGGIMGVPWAARNLDRLESFVYTNTVVFPYTWFPTAYRWGSRTIGGRFIASLSVSAIGSSQGSLFRKIFSKQHPQLSPVELDRFTTDFALNSTAKQTTLREFRMLTRDDFFDGYDEMRRKIFDAVPTVAVWGEDDPYIGNRFVNELITRNTVSLPDVGHWVPIVAADVL